MIKILYLYIFVSVVTFSIIYAQSCDCDVSDREERSYDALLNLDSTEKRVSEETHFPWGLPVNNPSATNEHLLHQVEYIINYDDDLRIPIWVGYRLRRQDVEVHRERIECFRRDIRLTDSSDASFCSDYEEPVFDRGHMVPNADMKRSEASMINTYILSNIVPQHNEFNRVIWARLEGYVRDWAVTRGEIYIITGVVLDTDNNGQRDNDSDADLVNPTNRVAIPTHFYKIIFYERPNSFIETMTFLLPHTEQSITGRNRANNYLINH